MKITGKIRPTQRRWLSPVAGGLRNPATPAIDYRRGLRFSGSSPQTLTIPMAARLRELLTHDVALRIIRRELPILHGVIYNERPTINIKTKKDAPGYEQRTPADWYYHFGQFFMDLLFYGTPTREGVIQYHRRQSEERDAVDFLRFMISVKGSVTPGEVRPAYEVVAGREEDWWHRAQEYYFELAQGVLTLEPKAALTRVLDSIQARLQRILESSELSQKVADAKNRHESLANHRGFFQILDQLPILWALYHLPHKIDPQSPPVDIYSERIPQALVPVCGERTTLEEGLCHFVLHLQQDLCWLLNPLIPLTDRRIRSIPSDQLPAEFSRRLAQTKIIFDFFGIEV